MQAAIRLFAAWKKLKIQKNSKNVLTNNFECGKTLNKKRILGKPVEMQGRKVNGPNPFLRNGSRLLFGDSVSDVF